MMQYIFTIPGINFSIPSYGFMMMVGFLAAIIWAGRRAQRSGADPEVILNCGFVALVGGVVGARAMYVIHYWENFERSSVASTIIAILNITQGGLEFYGGFILAMVGVVAYMVLWKHSLRWYIDIIAPSAMLGLAFGRVGCFLNGCCWGGVCDLPWAMEFPMGSPPMVKQWVEMEPRAALPAELIYAHPTGYALPVSRESLRASEAKIAQAATQQEQAERTVAGIQRKLALAAGTPEKSALERQLRQASLERLRARSNLGDVRSLMKNYGMTFPELKARAAHHHSAPVHPTQLYSVVAALLLALFLDRLYWRRTRDGQVICTLLLVQPIMRYLIEVIRDDNPLDTMGFTISQALAIALTLVGVGGFLILRALPPRSPRARLFVPETEESAKSKGKTATA